jgi:hypothetical protein
MKKIFSFFLVFFLLETTTIFGDFQVDTNLPFVKQEELKKEVDRIFTKFDTNLSRFSKDKQIDSLKIAIANIDALLEKEQFDVNKFIFSYLDYLLEEKLNYLILTEYD